MKNNTKGVFLLCCLLFLGQFSFAQEDSVKQEPLIVDDIQIDVKDVILDSTSKTVSLELFLTSYKRPERELKINAFGTKIVDAKGAESLFSSITLGKVLVKMEDKRNYLNYLMKVDEPVVFTVTIKNWSKGKPNELIFVFEDSEEEGHYIETAVQL